MRIFFSRDRTEEPSCSPRGTEQKNPEEIVILAVELPLLLAQKKLLFTGAGGFAKAGGFSFSRVEQKKQHLGPEGSRAEEKMSNSAWTFALGTPSKAQL